MIPQQVDIYIAQVQSMASTSTMLTGKYQRSVTMDMELLEMVEELSDYLVYSTAASFRQVVLTDFTVDRDFDWDSRVDQLRAFFQENELHWPCCYNCGEYVDPNDALMWADEDGDEDGDVSCRECATENTAEHDTLWTPGRLV